MLFFFVERLFQLNEYVGYAGIAIAVIVFILLYVVPIVKISRTNFFMTDVDKSNVRAAKRYNRRMREDIADKMIDLKQSTKDNGIFTDEKITSLAVARARNDDKELSAALTDIYNSDIKSAANKLISDSAIRVGISTTISQSEKVDTLIVTVTELNLVKKIVYLYGYRPNDAQMLKIYRTVFSNAIFAYGVQASAGAVAGGIAKLIGGVAESVPIISTIIGSVSSGIINSTLTVMIGFQTIRYLKREYKLQDILENVELDESEESEAKMISSVKSSVNSSTKKKSAKA